MTSPSASATRDLPELRHEHQVDRLFDVVFDRLERHHAILADRRATLARDMHAVAPRTRDVEDARQAFGRSRRPAICATAARDASSAHKIDMHAGRSGISSIDRHGHAPGRFRVRHRIILVVRQRHLPIRCSDPAHAVGPVTSSGLPAASDIAHARPAHRPQADAAAPLRHESPSAIDIAAAAPARAPRSPVAPEPPIGRVPAIKSLAIRCISFGTARSPTPISRRLSSMSRQNRSKSACPNSRAVAALAPPTGRETATRCSTIRSKRPLTVSGTP